MQSLLAQVRTLGQAVMSDAPPEQAQELQRWLDQAEAMATYQVMQDEIDAASEALGPHRAEFEALMADEMTATEHIHRLFSEERFAPMHYTAADVHRAFEVVGYPQRYGEGLREEGVETLVAAIVHLAGDEDARSQLAWRLMTMLPDYVAAGRTLDAWLIQYSAVQMVDRPDESNPFLFEMFQYGLAEWEDQVEVQEEALFQELGMDRLAAAGMSFDEVEAWVQARMLDPERQSRLEAYFAAHPQLRGHAEAEIRDLERSALWLLERDDADCLYLPPEEVVPWIPTLMERLEPAHAQCREAVGRGDWADSGVLKAVGDALVEVARDMVPAIFTPERLGQLVDDLRDYRRELLEAGEREAGMWAHAASLMLEHEDSPPDNRLLIGVCFASLRAGMIALAEDARSRAEHETETEEVQVDL